MFDSSVGMNRTADGGYTALPTDDPLPVVGEAELPATLGAPREKALRASPSADAQPRSCIETRCFQAAVVCAITANVLAIVACAQDARTKTALVLPLRFLLAFFVCELLVRVCSQRQHFFCGTQVLWNLIDVLVVAAGLVVFLRTQGLFPPIADTGVLGVVSRGLPLMPLIWMAKAVKIAMSRDMSWTEAPAFQSFIGGVITFNAILMGLETDIEWPGWAPIEYALLFVYIFELFARLKIQGFSYFSCENDDVWWNWLDMAIVSSSTLDTWMLPLWEIVSMTLSGGSGDSKRNGSSLGRMMVLMRMLRLMRILRLVKLVKSFRPLYILVSGMLSAIQGVFWVLVLTATVIYALGITATRIIARGLLFPEGEVPPEIFHPFGTVSDSMFTLFRIMAGSSSEAEGAGIDALLDRMPACKFGFAFFMITGSWTLLSILTAVVSDNMMSTTGEQMQEDAIVRDEEDRVTHMDDLRTLFKLIHSGAKSADDCGLSEEGLSTFLDDPENAEHTARQCRVPVRTVKDVLRVLHLNTERVTMDMFVEHLLDVGKVCTERSMLKIEAHLTTMQRVSEKLLVSLDEKILEQQASTSAMLLNLDQKLLDGQNEMKDHQRDMRDNLQEILTRLDSHRLEQHTSLIETSIRKLDGLEEVSNRQTSSIERMLDNLWDTAPLSARMDAAASEAVAGFRPLLDGLQETLDQLVREDRSVSTGVAGGSPMPSGQSSLVAPVVRAATLRRQRSGASAGADVAGGVHDGSEGSEGRGLEDAIEVGTAPGASFLPVPRFGFPSAAGAAPSPVALGEALGGELPPAACARPAKSRGPR